MSKLLVMADGRSVHTERWCRYFEDAGHEVALFSLEPCTIQSPRRVFLGKRPTSIGLLDYALAARYVRRVVREFRPDIISAHYVVSYGWLASYCTTCPVVVTAWGSDLLRLPQRSWIHRVRIARALAQAAACTVDSRNLAAVAARYLPPAKIHRAVMGVPQQLFDSAVKTDFGQRRPLRIIAPPGLQSVYDPDTIIAGVALAKDRLDLHLELMGGGEHFAAISSAIARASLSGRVKIKPFLPHGQYVNSLKEYDVYLSASLSDSTSVSLLEAMAVGLFPVVSDIEGNREWIRDGENGILFRPASAASLAEALASAEERRHTFPAVATINRRLVGADGIWETNMERVERLFLQLGEEWPGPR